MGKTCGKARGALKVDGLAKRSAIEKQHVNAEETQHNRDLASRHITSSETGSEP